MEKEYRKFNSYPQSIMTSGEKPISNDVKEFFEDQ